MTKKEEVIALADQYIKNNARFWKSRHVLNIFSRKGNNFFFFGHNNTSYQQTYFIPEE